MTPGSPHLRKKLTLALALTTTIACSSTSATTEGEQYFGVQYASVTFEIEELGDWKPGAIVGRFGSFMSDNFALEGRLGIGMGSDSKTFPAVGGGNVDVKIEVDTLVGIYGVGHHAINNQSSVYALIGISRGEATLSLASPFTGSESDTETDMSFGVGVNLNLNNTTAFNLEYVSYMSKNDFDLSAISFGFSSKF